MKKVKWIIHVEETFEVADDIVGEELDEIVHDAVCEYDAPTFGIGGLMASLKYEVLEEE